MLYNVLISNSPCHAWLNATFPKILHSIFSEWPLKTHCTSTYQALHNSYFLRQIENTEEINLIIPVVLNSFLRLGNSKFKFKSCVSPTFIY